MSYHKFQNHDGEHAADCAQRVHGANECTCGVANGYGSFEVFFHKHGPDCACADDNGGDALPDGYYWVAAFPGYMPDGEFNGPFDTEQEAIDDANDE
jgi:hypothetical protein